MALNKLKKLKTDLANKKMANAFGTEQILSTKRAIERNREIQNNAEISLKGAQEKLRNCLGSPLFKEYLKQYKQSEKDIIDTIIDLKVTTFEQYGAIVFDLVGRLKNIRFLLAEEGSNKEND